MRRIEVPDDLYCELISLIELGILYYAEALTEKKLTRNEQKAYKWAEKLVAGEYKKDEEPAKKKSVRKKRRKCAKATYPHISIGIPNY